MSIIITTELPTINDVTDAYNSTRRSIADAREKISALEKHEHIMGAPVTKEDAKRYHALELEKLHQQVHHLEKYAESLFDVLYKHSESLVDETIDDALSSIGYKE